MTSFAKKTVRVTPEAMAVLYSGAIKARQTVVSLRMMDGRAHLVFRAKGSRTEFPLAVETAFRSAVRNAAARATLEKINKRRKRA